MPLPTSRMWSAAANRGVESDAAPPAAKARQKKPRGPADAAADVEDVVGRRRRDQIRDVLRRLQAAAVEVIERRQLLDRRTIGIDALGRERGAQPLEQPAAAVVAGDQFGGGHRATPRMTCGATVISSNLTSATPAGR